MCTAINGDGCTTGAVNGDFWLSGGSHSQWQRHSAVPVMFTNILSHNVIGPTGQLAASHTRRAAVKNFRCGLLRVAPLNQRRLHLRHLQMLIAMS
jgi:hypothetical protein